MLRFMFFALAAVASFQPASAQQAPTPQAPSPQIARLDGLLAAKDYKQLGEIIGNVSTQDELWTDLGWLKDRMMGGESAFVTMLYARLLWNASLHLPAAEQHNLKQTAAMATLYAYSAIQIDGTRCGDRTAPAHRMQQLMGWNPDVWRFLAGLTEAERATVLMLVPLLESRTAAKRDAQGDVEFLCRAGMEETSYNLTHGSAREVPALPGQIGRQIQLSGDGKYKPSERPEAERVPDVLKRRAELPKVLAEQVASLAALKPVAK